MNFSTVLLTSGSSPLARGLRAVDNNSSGDSGIIPARAGFTYFYARSIALPGDHPRSRGVYDAAAGLIRGGGGSSPLARGLPWQWGSGMSSRWIIPARAGFTSGRMTGASGTGDHPRSRGVYMKDFYNGHPDLGSSPLARGLPRRRARVQSRARIIPARAGFTQYD